MNKGQASIVMIVVIAIAFVFYAVELNWGKLSDFKISTWQAANSSTAMMASNFSSYAEKVLWENLLNSDALDNWDSIERTNDETVKACQETMFWFKILVAIIVLILVIVTFGAATPLLAIVIISLTAVALATALVLEIAYIGPLQMSLWNKLMQNMDSLDQFREYGVQAGIQSVASDNVQIPDRFDMNGNGKWGFTTKLDKNGNPYANDMMSRFSFFYTERLKLVNKKQGYANLNTSSATYNDFRNSLNSLIYNPATSTVRPGLGFSPYCSNSGGSGIVTIDILNQAGYTIDSPEILLLLMGTDSTALQFPNPTGPWASADSSDNAVLSPTLNLNDTTTLDQMRQTFAAKGIDFTNLFPVLKRVQKRSSYSPLCNPDCTLDKGSAGHNYGLGWDYGQTTASGQQKYVLDSCNACTDTRVCPSFVANATVPANFDANNFRLLYSPYTEDPLSYNSNNLADTSNAFRVRLGHDDEMGKDAGASNVPAEALYDPNRASGLVFPMLNSMDALKSGHDSTYDLYQSLVTAGVYSSIASIPASIPRYPDNISKLGVTANSNDCAQDSDSQNGFLWKKGADQYCSDRVSNSVYKKEVSLAYQKVDPGYTGTTVPEDQYYLKIWGSGALTQAGASGVPYHWPYSDCTYRKDSTGKSITCQQSSDKSLWPQDRLDSLIYGLPLLMAINNRLSTFSLDQLNASVAQWYPYVAQFVAPKCSTSSGGSGVDGSSLATLLSNAVASKLSATDPSYTNWAKDTNVCNPGQQGLLIQWWYDLDNWQKQLDTWMTTATVSSAAEVCSGGSLDLSNPSSLLTCLKNKTAFLNDLTVCKNGIAGDPTNPAFPSAAPASLALSCKKVLYEGLTSGTDKLITAPDSSITTKPDPANNYAADYTVSDTTIFNLIKNWIYTEQALEQGTSPRYAELSAMTTKATNVRDLFREGRDDFYNFLVGPMTSIASSTLGIHPNAYDLMEARQRQGDSSSPVQTAPPSDPADNLHIKNLPGFLIYGWKDDLSRTIDGVTQKGFWHIARMEVAIPSSLPKVKASKEGGILDDKNCYTLNGGKGDVYARATRWDESKTSRTPSQFANKKTIWTFNFAGFNNTTGAGIDSCKDFPDISAGGDPGLMLDTYCAGKSIGLSTATQQGLQLDGFCDPSTQSCVKKLIACNPTLDPKKANVLNDEACNLRNAFMFNVDPTTKTTSSSEEKACWCLVHTLLNAGISSSSHAQWHIPKAQDGSTDWHVMIKFDDPKKAESWFDSLGRTSYSNTTDSTNAT